MILFVSNVQLDIDHQLKLENAISLMSNLSK